MTDKKKQNRGQVRERLIDAGLAILATDGYRALTLRACAARAGVSHAAPAHHFDGVSGLFTAIGARGYQTFTRYMTDERDRAADDPQSRLYAIGRGYLAFAHDHHGLFTLMFNSGVELVPDQELQHHADAVFSVLTEACQPFEPVTNSFMATEIMVWSIVHGLACLIEGGRFALPNPAGRIPVIEDIMPPLRLRGHKPG